MTGRDRIKKRDTCSLIVGPKFEAKKVLEGKLKLPEGEWRPFCYQTRSHPSHIDDPRGFYLLACDFFFYLPEPQASSFWAEVTESPDLIEGVFRGVYGEAIERGLTRVQANKLQYVDFSNAKLPIDKLPGEISILTKDFSVPAGEEPWTI